MAIAAAKKALQNANIDNKDIDLIIVATTTPDKTFPATAVKVQSELNIGICPAFDIQAVCAGFIYALNVGSSLLKTSNFSVSLSIYFKIFSSSHSGIFFNHDLFGRSSKDRIRFLPFLKFKLEFLQNIV